MRFICQNKIRRKKICPACSLRKEMCSNKYIRLTDILRCCYPSCTRLIVWFQAIILPDAQSMYSKNFKQFPGVNSRGNLDTVAFCVSFHHKFDLYDEHLHAIAFFHSHPIINTVKFIYFRFIVNSIQMCRLSCVILPVSFQFYFWMFNHDEVSSLLSMKIKTSSVWKKSI